MTSDSHLISSPTNTANEYDTGYYSSNVYTETLIRYLSERTSKEKEKPFFAALTFAAPHWPLQCSKADREKYEVSWIKVLADDRVYTMLDHQPCETDESRG